MRGYFAILFIFLLVFSPVLADGAISEQISLASTEVSEFFSGVPLDDIVIVTGSGISIEDRILFNLIRSQVGDIQGVIVEQDNQQVDVKGKALVLIGGQRTNIIAKSLESELVDVKESSYEPVILRFGRLKGGGKVMVMFSTKEIENNQNQGIVRSPLNSVIDRKYVPIAATLVSVLLLYLWSLLAKTALSLANDFISSKVIGRATKDKKVSDRKKAYDVKVHEIMTRPELISLAITIIIFSITMSYAWSGDIQEFFEMLTINIIIVSIVSILREFARQYLCYRGKVRTEYIFWPFGTLVTIISTYFGNTFSLVSYSLTDESLSEEKKFGKWAYLISALTFLVAATAYLVNIFMPSIILQMIFVYCIMTVFIEFFPMSPFAGKDMREWRFATWLLSYILVFVSYIYMNFTLYV